MNVSTDMLCEDDVEKLRNWKALNSPELAEVLAERGWQELRLLGKG